MAANCSSASFVLGSVLLWIAHKISSSPSGLRSRGRNRQAAWGAVRLNYGGTNLSQQCEDNLQCNLTSLFLRMASTLLFALVACTDVECKELDDAPVLEVHTEWSAWVLVASSMVGPSDEVDPMMLDREPTMSLGRVCSELASISLSSRLREAFVCFIKEPWGFDEEVDVGRGVGVSNEALGRECE